MTEDGIATKYLELITNDPTRAYINLSRMYGEIFEIQGGTELYKVFGRLCKIYGSSIVFYAILDVAGMETLDVSNPYPILSYFCKKRLVSLTPNPVVDLSDYIEKQKKDLGKKRNIKMRPLE